MSDLSYNRLVGLISRFSVKKTANSIISLASSVDSIICHPNSPSCYIPDPKPGYPCAILVENIDMQWGTGEFSSLLQKNKISFNKSTKEKGSTFGIVYFDSNSDRRSAFSILYSLHVGNRVITVVPLTSSLTDTIHDSDRCRHCHKSTNFSLKRSVFPFTDIDENEQIRQKKLSCLKALFPILPKSYPFVELIQCSKEDCIRSYADLQFGHNEQGEPIAGIRFLSMSASAVYPIDNLRCFSQKVVDAANHLSAFVKNSNLPPFNPLTRCGVWKSASVRFTRKSQSQLVVLVSSKVENSISQRLSDEFKSDFSSIYISDSLSEQSLNLLYGDATVDEEFFHNIVKIAPLSSLPHNLAADEIIASQIIRSDLISENDIFVDLFCGIGNFPFAFAKISKASIGIANSELESETLSKSAEENGLKNVSFPFGFVDSVLPSILSDEGSYIIFAHQKLALSHRALATLRKPCVKAIIWAGTSPSSVVPCIKSDLLSEGDTKAFRPTDWFAVDCFPDSPKSISVIVLSRAD